MKALAILFTAALFVAPALAAAATVNSFEGGATEAVAGLAPPSYTSIVNVSIPAESHLKKSVVDVSAIPGNQKYPGGPSNVSVSLGNETLWAFSGQAYGALGNQTLFGNGNATVARRFADGGGAFSSAIRLPKKAVVDGHRQGLLGR